MEASKAIEAIKEHFDGEYFSIFDTCSAHSIPAGAQKLEDGVAKPFDHIFSVNDDNEGYVYFPVGDGRYIVADYAT